MNIQLYNQWVSNKKQHYVYLSLNPNSYSIKKKSNKKYKYIDDFKDYKVIYH